MLKFDRLRFRGRRRRLPFIFNLYRVRPAVFLDRVFWDADNPSPQTNSLVSEPVS